MAQSSVVERIFSKYSPGLTALQRHQYSWSSAWRSIPASHLRPVEGVESMKPLFCFSRPDRFRSRRRTRPVLNERHEEHLCPTSFATVYTTCWRCRPRRLIISSHFDLAFCGGARTGRQQAVSGPCQERGEFESLSDKYPSCWKSLQSSRDERDRARPDAFC